MRSASICIDLEIKAFVWIDCCIIAAPNQVLGVWKISNQPRMSQGEISWAIYTLYIVDIRSVLLRAVSRHEVVSRSSGFGLIECDIESWRTEISSLSILWLVHIWRIRDEALLTDLKAERGSVSLLGAATELRME